MKMRLRRPPPPAASPPAPLLCRWDLDKTYLRSDFDSIRQLLRTAFERGADKVEVPGVAELIKALKETAEAAGRPTLVYFLSASPPQIGKAIREKLTLDGVPYDGIVFKNQLANLKAGKLRNLREHVGFKLSELLRGRLGAPAEARELLFGDDWESDSLIYSLYADVLGGSLDPPRLTAILTRLRVDPSLVTDILALAARARGRDVVERIFINLERRTPPGVFQLFGPRVVPTFNYFQTAAVLAGRGYLTVDGVERVARVLLERAGYSARQLENSLDDLVRRGHLGVTESADLVRPLRARGVVPPVARAGPPWRRVLERLRRPPERVHSTPPRAAPAALDYDAIVTHLQHARAAAGR